MLTDEGWCTGVHAASAQLVGDLFAEPLPSSAEDNVLIENGIYPVWAEAAITAACHAGERVMARLTSGRKYRDIYAFVFFPVKL